VSQANQEQIEYWNGHAGHTWVEAQERLDAMLTPISAALLNLADPRPGERGEDGIRLGSACWLVHARPA
jgi:hypothetical protein